MSVLATDAPLATDRPDLVQGVRDAFDRAGFDAQRIPGRLGGDSMDKLTFGPLDRPKHLWRTREGDPLATLIRLFLIGVPVDPAAFERAVAPMAIDDWRTLGLVESDHRGIHRAVAIRPSGPLLMAYDHALPGEGQRYDHVLGVSGTTRFLANATVRRHARRTLDLGTGGGYQALIAAPHSDLVLGTDRNPRAIVFARFNAQLNGIANVEFATGDLFEPVHGLLFDLIVANPPFVVSPDHQLQFRDSGLKGDEISEKIVRAVPQYLEEGGRAQLLCSWVRFAGHDPHERITEWLKGSGCDAWVIHQSETIDQYADHWVRQGDIAHPDQLEAAFNRWVEYYRQQEIESIETALVTLRRRSAGGNWTRFDTNRRLNHPNGQGIQAGFDSHDLLDSLDENAILGLGLRCHPEMRWTQKLKPCPTGWIVDDARCILGDGLEFEGALNQVVFHLLTSLRGEVTLAQAIQAAASRSGQPVEPILPMCIGAVRSLIDQGFLEPVLPVDLGKSSS